MEQNELFQNKIKTGGGSWRYIFLTRPPEILRFVTAPLQIPGKKAFTLWNSPKLGDTLWKFQDQNQEFFLNTTGRFTSFLIDPWNFQFLSSTPPTCLDFFWNSPVSMDITPKNCYAAMTDWLNTQSCDKLGLELNGMWSIENQEIKNISCLIQMLTMISQTVTIREIGDVIDLIPWNARMLNFSSKLSYWIPHTSFHVLTRNPPENPHLPILGPLGKFTRFTISISICIYKMMRIPIIFVSILLIANRDLPIYPLLLFHYAWKDPQ